MGSVVQGEKVVAQMDHRVEYGSVAFEVEDPFAVGEHSAFQKAFYEVFRFMDDGFFVGSSEVARAPVVTMVVDESVFVPYFFQYAEFVEDDVAEILFKSEKERLRLFGQMLRLKEIVRSEKAVGHVRRRLDLEEGEIARAVRACGEIIGFFADDPKNRERIGNEAHSADVVFLLFDDEHAEIQYVRQESVAFDVDFHDFGEFHDFDVFFEYEGA